MKIGIVTYHRSLNYGAVMQSLATRFALEEMGHEVYYVDYWPDYHRKIYECFSFRKFIKYIFKLHAVSYLKMSVWKKRRHDHFDAFFKLYIYPYCRPIDENYDVVIYGSDQIWRKQNALRTYNPFYFGKNNINAKHHVSYAASMGILPDNDTDKAKVKELISHLEKISVREDDLKRMLMDLGYGNVALSLDPTLLLNSEQWNRQVPTPPYDKEKYALLYTIKTNAFDLREVRRFTDSKGMKLIILNGYATSQETDTNLTTVGPSEFLQLFKNADYVFSCSFHGLAFSIIYRKQFFASFVKNAGRAETLLNLVGASHRLLAPMGVIPQDIKPIDFEDVQARLAVAKQESLKFLSQLQ